MEARVLRRLTVDEYLELDRTSEERWEFVNGQAWAMSGASRRHNAVSVNVMVALHAKLRAGPCRPWADGQKIETVATGAFHYPDVSVVCGKPVAGQRDSQSIANPSVIAEVLSGSFLDLPYEEMLRAFAETYAKNGVPTLPSRTDEAFHES